jgi:hypothetical protein
VKKKTKILVIKKMKCALLVFVVLFVIHSCFAFNSLCLVSEALISNYAASFDHLVAVGSLQNNTSPAFTNALNQLLSSFCSSFSGLTIYTSGDQLYSFASLSQLSTYYTSLPKNQYVNISRQVITNAQCSDSFTPMTYNATLDHKYIDSSFRWTNSLGWYNFILNYSVVNKNMCIQQVTLYVVATVQWPDVVVVNQSPVNN